MSSLYLAIDPGNIFSAYTIIDDAKNLLDFGILENNALKKKIEQDDFDSEFNLVAIEMLQCYGMPVGKSVLDTCVWIGRFQEVIEDNYHIDVDFYGRKKVVAHICGSVQAGDKNIRQAILDMYPATGGGATPQIGIKKQRGPLFGVSKDVWAALAVAITYRDNCND